jgi:hypothetical protein
MVAPCARYEQWLAASSGLYGRLLGVCTTARKWMTAHADDAAMSSVRF